MSETLKKVKDEEKYEFDFSDMQWIEIPVTGPDNEEYILRELDAAGARKYNDARISGVTMEDGKVVKVENIGGLEVLLVSLCLRAVNKRPIRPQSIEGWQERIIKKLFDKAKEISDIEEESADGNLVVLKQTFGREDAPFPYEEIKRFVDSQTDDYYKPLQKAMAAADKEDSAKNLPKSSTDNLR